MLTLLALAALCLASQTGESPTLPQPGRRGARTPHPSNAVPLAVQPPPPGGQAPSICPSSVLVEGEGREQTARGAGEGLRGQLGSFLLQMQSPVVQSLTEEQVGGRPDRGFVPHHPAAQRSLTLAPSVPFSPSYWLLSGC